MAEPAQPYLIGRAMTDITGPALGMQLWGFGRPDQMGEGIHIRQRARAFVIAQSDQPQQRIAFVSADIGSIDHHITLEVIDRLKKLLGEHYGLHNVILSATHTHAGPGGYWHSRTDTGLDGGFYPEHFEAIVSGITQAIVKAHEDLQPGSLFINQGEVANAGKNRSEVAYLENPAQERARYSSNTNKTMTVLRFTDDTGDIGMLNWYALHPTAMNFYNKLISGDHKGYASLQVEQSFGVRYDDAQDFVAAFAQSDPGDVTPNDNLNNTGPGETDVETARIMGERQLQMAQQLFASASEVLTGPIETRQIYVDLRNYEVQNAFTGAGVQHTCPSAYGYSFAGGSSEDGGAHFLFYEGMIGQSVWRDWLIRTVTGAPKWTEAVRLCQLPKPILFETGSGESPLQSQIRSLTLVRVGQLVILALPAEVTTMAGRRLRETVMDTVGDWADYVVLAGYSNGYAGYITTPQEYQLQQYEGSHTLHGQWTLPAYQQIAQQLATALDTDSVVISSARYDDWRGKSEAISLPGKDNTKIKGETSNNSRERTHPLGSPVALRDTKFKPGDTVEAQFLSTHPNLAYVTGNNFLTVEKKTESGWQFVASDADWYSRILWREDGDEFVASVRWSIPQGTSPGSYRILHQGLDADGSVFNGTSETIEVQKH